MKNKDIEELKKITNNNPKVLDWIDNNIEYIEFNQLIINEKYFGLEHSDMIKKEMINRIAEELLEKIVNIKKTKTGYDLKIFAIKRTNRRK